MIGDNIKLSFFKLKNLIFFIFLDRKEVPFTHLILIINFAKRSINTFCFKIKCHENALLNGQDEDLPCPRLILALNLILLGCAEIKQAVNAVQT